MLVKSWQSRLWTCLRYAGEKAQIITKEFLRCSFRCFFLCNSLTVSVCIIIKFALLSPTYKSKSITSKTYFSLADSSVFLVSFHVNKLTKNLQVELMHWLSQSSAVSFLPLDGVSLRNDCCCSSREVSFLL